MPLGRGLGRVEVGRGIGEDRDAAHTWLLLAAGPGRCGHDTGRVQPRPLRTATISRDGSVAPRPSSSAPSRSASAPGLTGAMLGALPRPPARARRPGGRRPRRRPVRGDCSTWPSWSSRRSSASCPTGYGHHRVMLYGPIFGAIAVVLTGLTTNLFRCSAGRASSRARRPPRASRRSSASSRSRPPATRCSAARRPRASRARPCRASGLGFDRRAEAVRGHRTGGLLPQRRCSTASRS